LDIHFLHIRSEQANALPLLLTHGWPGSIAEFLKVVGPLTDASAHGGDAEDAFHLVIPSMPGFGFSEKPSNKGRNLTRIAEAWAELMPRLGYRRYVAQGGDLGAGVTTQMAKAKSSGIAAIHLNLPLFSPPPIEGEPTAREKAQSRN
jgi:pimeloyl-ACP methyl ester carboxylesterase